MKILVVTQYFWPEDFRINDLVLGLKERGHEVEVLTGKPNYPAGRFFAGYGYFSKAREEYGGMAVMRVPLVPRGKGGAARLLLNYLSFAFFASLLAPFSCRSTYDVIFVFEPSPITVCLPALLLGKLRKIPVALWVQDLWPESLSATGAVKARWILDGVEALVRFIYKGCDLVLLQSRAFLPSVERLGVNRTKAQYFPNSAEAFYAPVGLAADAPERAGMPEGFKVMFAGNIGAAQDFETILGAAERLKPHADIRWVILGDGRMLPWVKKEIGERGLSGIVHLLGKHPVAAMPRYFALADALLVTLRKDPLFALTIPSKVQSYLACGKPIVAALDGEGARIVAEAGAGLAVNAGNPEALANAVLEMYRMDTGRRHKMGANGRAYFEAHFERNILLARLEELLGGINQGGAH